MSKTKLEEKVELAKPRMFKVILLNDEVTTMDFVIEVLVDIFHLSFENASKLMLEIHHLGKGVCGIYTQEIALSKQKQVQNAAKVANFPLQVKVEEE